MSLKDFQRAYIECALWSSVDSEGEPLDRNYTADDIPADVLDEMKEDCRKFYEANSDTWFDQLLCQRELTEDGRAGFDFWLTREGHGCGFWDGDWAEPAATKLTEASKKFGEYWRISEIEFDNSES